MRAWEKNIRRVEPYVPGEQPKLLDMVKLNTNENPYPPSPKVAETLKNFDCDRLKLYPDPEITGLVNAIAKEYEVSPNQVFVGVGSDDVLAMCFMTFFNSDKPVLFPNISYAFYSVWAELYGIPYETVKLDEDFNIVPESFIRENGGIIFPNPNAPTSICMGLDKIEQIVSANQDSIVIVDEAYIDFGGKSALELVNKYDNLIVVQTYSKSRSMAGMRIGYAISNEYIISALNSVKFSYNSYTMNNVAIECGIAAIEDREYFKACVDKIINTRQRSKKCFTELGFTYPDSMANFMFVTHNQVPAKKIFEELKKDNIFVRYFDKPLIDNYLRITIGTDEEMDRLFEALEKICNQA